MIDVIYRPESIMAVQTVTVGMIDYEQQSQSIFHQMFGEINYYNPN